MLFRKQLKKGTGTPVVFLHGFLGTSSDWEEVCSHLPACNAIGFDLPGHGKSAFTEHFDIDLPFFHLVGYSMGGRLALSLPKKKIASMTLISVHPGLKTEEEKKLRWEQDLRWEKQLRELPIDEFLSHWYHQQLFHTFKPNLAKRREQNVQDLAKAFLHYSLAKQPYYPLENVLVGALDAKFLSLHKNPIVIENASHAVHLENPQAVASIIRQRIGV